MSGRKRCVFRLVSAGTLYYWPSCLALLRVEVKWEMWDRNEEAHYPMVAVCPSSSPVVLLGLGRTKGESSCPMERLVIYYCITLDYDRVSSRRFRFAVHIPIIDSTWGRCLLLRFRHDSEGIRSESRLSIKDTREEVQMKIWTTSI